jgi:uncharacterized membrane protein YdjX (TVP38/TMEM64 family)
MKRRAARVLVIVALVVLPFALLRIDAVRAWLSALVDHLRVAGPAGWAAFLAVDVAGAIVVAPLWLMSGIAGYVYGFAHGFALAMPGVALGAFAAFGAGRLGLTRLLAPHASEKGALLAIHRAVEREGIKIVLLLRISVLPQGMLSYVLATTPMRFRDFALATTVGLIPTTIIQVYVGSIVRDLAALFEGDAPMPGTWRWLLVGATVLITITALTIITRVTRATLRRAMQAEVKV